MLKKGRAFDSYWMIALLLETVVASFFVVEKLDPKQLAEITQILQIILDFGGGVPFKVAHHIWNLIVRGVANDGVEVVGHKDITVQL